jgi:hypothetical protein
MIETRGRQQFMVGPKKRAVKQQLSGLLLSTLLVLALECAAQSARSWTPMTSVEVRYIVEIQRSPFAWDASGSESHPVVASPDGRRLYFISRRGDLL